VPQTALKVEPTMPQPTSPQINEARDLVRETIAETNPKQRAEKLLNVLFAENFTYQQGKYISPLNAESAGQELSRDGQAKKQKELFTSLAEVKEAIERNDGISEETYERHKYAINSIARDLVDQRWWGNNLSHLCEKEDREGKKATAEQIAKFPDDTDFTEERHGHTNIFDQGYERSVFEGTLFETKFDPNGNLATYKIFHQGHRDALRIRTVNITELVSKIKSFVAEFTEEVPGQQFGFTLDKKAYLQKMAEFNEQFGNFVTLEVIGNNVVAIFNANPQQVAKKLVELGNAEGMKLTSEARSGYVIKGTNDSDGRFHYADLLLLDNMEVKYDTFDPKKHKNTHTALLPYLTPEFAIDLITMYATQEEKVCGSAIAEKRK